MRRNIKNQYKYIREIRLNINKYIISHRTRNILTKYYIDANTSLLRSIISLQHQEKSLKTKKKE